MVAIREAKRAALKAGKPWPPRDRKLLKLSRCAFECIHRKPLMMDERRGFGFECERLDVLSARESCLAFDVAAAFIQLPADRSNLSEDPFSSA